MKRPRFGGFFICSKTAWKSALYQI